MLYSNYGGDTSLEAQETGILLLHGFNTSFLNNFTKEPYTEFYKYNITATEEKMKKVLAIFMALTLCLGVTACGAGQEAVSETKVIAAAAEDAENYSGTVTVYT